jgi:hypothetical protein
MVFAANKPKSVYLGYPRAEDQVEVFARQAVPPDGS